MARVRAKARILENSITPGNGPYALNALSPDYNRFASIMAIGDVTEASVIEPGVAFWTGLVTYSNTNEITLTTVEEAKGTFGAGTKEIMAGPLASQSMFPEDIAGAIVTGGTSTAYTVASYRKYDTLARLDGNLIAFTPHVTNGANGTGLNVDGLGIKPLLASPGVGLGSSVLIQGTPYLALYNNTDGAFYLHSMGGNPYGIPLGAGMDYWLPTAPSSAFAFPIGQAISRTTYAKLFAAMGTAYGPGDGSTTFNLPDRRGRGSTQLDPTGTILTSATMSPDGNTLGAKGGGQLSTLGTSNLPPYTPSGSVGSTLNSNIQGVNVVITTGGSNVKDVGPLVAITSSINVNQSVTSSFTGAAQGGSSVPFSNIGPRIACNYIMRVL
jgi:microcystin-dependent protein